MSARAAQSPNCVCVRCKADPIAGNASKATEFSTKTVPSETAISSSLALVIGATAAMALPPQIAVPVENFRSRKPHPSRSTYFLFVFLMSRRIIRLQRLCECSLRACTRIQKSAKFIGQPVRFNAGRVSDTEVSSDAQTRNFNSLKMSAKPEILRHRLARYKAHSESGFHRRLDGFGRIQFHHNS